MADERRAPLPRTILVCGILVSGLAGSVHAQEQVAPPARVEATRPELEAIAAHPPKGMSAGDLAAVESRLAVGDFTVGDKILLYVAGEETLSDTFPIRQGRVLMLPSLPPLSMEGVLRSEADSLITGFLARYLRDPQVTVTPLVRLGILGGVVRPGYYDVPAQSLLSELVMIGGGMTTVANMKRSKVNRQNQEVMDSKAISEAIANAQTLDLLNLQSGDNFDVGVQDPGKNLEKVQILTALLAIPLMIVSISAIAK